MNKIEYPAIWSDIYPQGTPEGDEEQDLFISLARDKKYSFKTISQIALETGLKKDRIEQIIGKYAKLNILIQNPKNEDAWGYWENCIDLIPKKYISIADMSRQQRIEEVTKKNRS